MMQGKRYAHRKSKLDDPSWASIYAHSAALQQLCTTLSRLPALRYHQKAHAIIDAESEREGVLCPQQGIRGTCMPLPERLPQQVSGRVLLGRRLLPMKRRAVLCQPPEAVAVELPAPGCSVVHSRWHHQPASTHAMQPLACPRGEGEISARMHTPLLRCQTQAMPCTVSG